MLAHDLRAQGVGGGRSPKQVEYLASYLEAEAASRDASKRASLLRRCGLPAPKTFDGYDWSAVSWPEGLGRDNLLSLAFLERREDLVLMGDVGTGKTHMASALCQLACDRRLEARFFTASSLVMRLRRAREEGRLDREMSQIARARLLVIDELGFCRSTPTARASSSRSSPTPTRGRASSSPPTWSSRAGEASSATTRWPPPSSTASSTTAGSCSLEGSRTGCAMRSCRRGSRSKITAQIACPCCSIPNAHSAQNYLTKHTHRRRRGV